jgi:hypothetical protein
VVLRQFIGRKHRAAMLHFLRSRTTALSVIAELPMSANARSARRALSTVRSNLGMIDFPNAVEHPLEIFPEVTANLLFFPTAPR